MEAVHFRQGDYPAGFRGLDRSGMGAIHCKGKMGAKSVIVGDIRLDHAPQMPLVEHDDMIEHIATDTPDDPLAIRILPGTAWGDLDLFDAHVAEALLKMCSVDAIAVAQEISWCSVPRKRLHDLLQTPVVRRNYV